MENELDVGGEAGKINRRKKREKNSRRKKGK
jgi:hypothetical protein